MAIDAGDVISEELTQQSIRASREAASKLLHFIGTLAPNFNPFSGLFDKDKSFSEWLEEKYEKLPEVKKFKEDNPEGLDEDLESVEDFERAVVSDEVAEQYNERAEFVQGDPDNAHLEVVTIDRDPECNYVSKIFEDRSIPFNRTVKDGLVDFEVNPYSVPAVGGVVSMLCASVRDFNVKRFPNIDEFKSCAPDLMGEENINGSFEVADLDEAIAIKTFFDEKDISYNMFGRDEEGCTFEVSNLDLFEKGIDSEQIREAFRSNDLQEKIIEQIQASKDLKSEIAETREQAKSKVRVEEKSKDKLTPKKDKARADAHLKTMGHDKVQDINKTMGSR